MGPLTHIHVNVLGLRFWVGEMVRRNPETLSDSHARHAKGRYVYRPIKTPQ